MNEGPQCEDGYTKLANELLEAMCRFRIPGESMQIFLTILRKTYGFGKKMDVIALNQFVEATGIPKPNVVRSLRQLLTLNVIRVEKHDVIVSYGVNKHHETWRRERRETIRPLSKAITEIVIENDNDIIKSDNASLSEVITGVIKSDNESLSKVIPTKEKKETITKETTTKETLPDFIPREEWFAYVEMRKKIRKPLTPLAERLAFQKLADLRNKGHDPVDVLNQSVFNSWQGLFEIKGNSGKGQTADDVRRQNHAAARDFVESAARGDFSR